MTNSSKPGDKVKVIYRDTLDDVCKARYDEKLSYIDGKDPYTMSKEDWLCRLILRRTPIFRAQFFKSNPVGFRITDWIKSWKWVFQKQKRDSELRSDHVIRS